MIYTLEKANVVESSRTAVADGKNTHLRTDPSPLTRNKDMLDGLKDIIGSKGKTA